MANITLHSDSSNSVTSVSNVFIDEYMSDANGEFVKIYLYLLRLMGKPDTAFSISSLADKFEHTEKDIRRALCYWERMHLLSLEYDGEENLTGIRLLDSRSRQEPSVSVPNAGQTEEPSAPENHQTEDVRSVSEPVKKIYSVDDIRQFRQNEAIAELFFIAERYLGRTLSEPDVNTILYFYDVLGFSADLIEYLVEYCVSRGHTSIRYIEKVALAWADSDISTVEEAKQAAAMRGQSYFTVMKSLGISGRNLVPSETALIEKWKTEYGFSDEMIAEACQKTIQAIHQPSFEYTDSILSTWRKNQVKSPADAAKLDAAYQQRKKDAALKPPARAASKNKFNNFNQRTYDYDQLEEMLLTTTVR